MTFPKSGLIAPTVALAAIAGVAAVAYSSLSTRARLPAMITTGAVQERPVAPASAPAEEAATTRLAERAKDGVRVDAPGTKVDKGGREVRVRAPHTQVDVDKERGKVRVKAPYTDVRVDPDKGQVRVKAPYVDLDIRW